jgi:homoserine kinase type II
MTRDTEAELKEILRHYDVGELKTWEQNDRGYCNISYAIETVADGKRNRFFLRKYKKGARESEIKFEHSVINHLLENGFDLVARILETRDGRSYVRRLADGEAVFYAVFDFLSGEDRYTWIGPQCSAREVKSAAAVLARFHATMFGFSPLGRRDEPKTVDVLPAVAENVKGNAQKSGDTVFDVYLAENLDLIVRNVVRTRCALAERACRELVQVVIHCDYHPGNLKFQGQEATGLFDFDWSKVDARCFDVALAVYYFFAAWEEGRGGAFDLNRLALFLEAYQRTLRGTPGIGPLSDIELRYLPHMINASNFFVLNWTVADFFDSEVDPQEYLIYLRHGVHVMRWLENRDNWDRLVQTIDTVR